MVMSRWARTASSRAHHHVPHPHEERCVHASSLMQPPLHRRLCSVATACHGFPEAKICRCRACAAFSCWFSHTTSVGACCWALGAILFKFSTQLLRQSEHAVPGDEEVLGMDNVLYLSEAEGATDLRKMQATAVQNFACETVRDLVV